MTFRRTPQDMLGSTHWYVNELPEQVLPEWMNSARGTPSYRRMEQLLNLIATVPRVSAMTPWVSSSRDASKTRSNIRKKQAAFHKLHHSLSLLLERYDYKSSLVYATSGRRWGHAIWPATDRNSFVLKRNTGRSVYEADLALMVCKLAAEGRLDRFRPCGHCQRWLFAAKKMKKYCDEVCRKASKVELRKSPLGKKKAREYMRLYRQNPMAKKQQ